MNDRKQMSEEELRKGAKKIAKMLPRDPDERRYAMDYLMKIVHGIEPKLDPAIQHVPPAEVRTGPLQFGDGSPGFYFTPDDMHCYVHLIEAIVPEPEQNHDWRLDQLARLAHCMRANLTQGGDDD